MKESKPGSTLGDGMTMGAAASAEHGDSDYLAVSLSVSSRQLSPDEITLAVGIEPTYRRERGAPIRGGLMRRVEFDLHEWQFRQQLDIKPDDDVSKLSGLFISGFLGKLIQAAPRIRELSTGHDVLIQIVYSVHSMPYVGLMSADIRAIASLGARLDYDFMVDV